MTSAHETDEFGIFADTYPASDVLWAIATPLIAAVVVGVGAGIFAAVKGSLTP